MPGEAVGSVGLRDRKVEYVVVGRVHPLIGYCPCPRRLVVGVCGYLGLEDLEVGDR